jgi:hypothetical protein
MVNRKVCGKEFSIKSGIAGFCGGEFVGEKDQRTPGAPGIMLEDTSNMGV